MTTDNPRQRPFKVWSADRSTRKGVIASNLADLIRKGKVKLDIQEGESVAVVLEADGTEVDDDYFKRLDENTVFLLLKLGERWYPPGVEAIRAGGSPRRGTKFWTEKKHERRDGHPYRQSRIVRVLRLCSPSTSAKEEDIETG